MKRTFKQKVFSSMYRLHNKARQLEENAQSYREKAKWAFLAGFSRAGVLWLSQP